MKDLFTLEKEFLSSFDTKHRAEYQAQFWRLLEDKFSLKRIDAVSGLKSLSNNDLSLFTSGLNRLKNGEVLQHLVGWELFAGRRFKVNSEVLIPRPETEELVYLVQENFGDAKRIIDLATGSGCIGVSLKKKTNTVYALEKSSAALKIARFNADALGAEVEFIQDDLLEPKLDWPIEMDLVISNPPYVTWKEREDMDARVYEKEPEMALFVPDNDPLVFYRRIKAYASEALMKGGVLALEINQYLSEETKDLIEEDFDHVEILQDQFGKPRFIWAIK